VGASVICGCLNCGKEYDDARQSPLCPHNNLPDQGEGAPSAADGKLPAKACNARLAAQRRPTFERDFFRTAAMFLFSRLECVERPRFESGLGELDARAELRAILGEWRHAHAKNRQ
jgi:hypothetical protein